MESLFHLFFVIIKIGILSVFYTYIIIGFIWAINKIHSPATQRKIILNKFRTFRFPLFSIIYIVLFLFSFSYWGNHGLGDFARIPIGNQKEVKQINAINTYLEDENGNQIGISDFYYGANRLYAKINDGFIPGEYLLWNLNEKSWVVINNQEEYMKEIYPVIDYLKSFQEHYKDYWSGWRFWLLP